LLSLLADYAIIDCMAVLTIRNLDDAVKHKLQVRAALHGRSMEAEAREVLTESTRHAPANTTGSAGLGTAVHNLFASFGGVELEIPKRRKSRRKTPAFE
jgi:plasmid stability protein